MHLSGTDRSQLGHIALIDHQHLRLAVTAALHRPLRHQNGLRIVTLIDCHAHVHARQQQGIGVVKQTAQRYLTGAAIDRDIGKHQPPLPLLLAAFDAQ